MDEILKQEELSQFTGTTRYYKNFLGLNFTEGVKYVADKGGAYWLIDAVASYQPKLKAVPFQLWELKVNDSKGILTCREDTGQPDLVKQHIPYTDFPFDIELYCIDNILLLPSEY